MQEFSDVAARAIRDRVFPGCVIGVVEGGVRSVHAFGRYTYESDSRAVVEDSLYDCASLTKSVVTATLAFHFIDEGQLAFDDKLIEYVPEYRTKYRDEVTIYHLLTYTLGNSMPLSRAGGTPEEIFAAVCTEDTKPPGTAFNYSNTPAFLLGIVLERLAGRPLDRLAQREIFEPRGMAQTTFHPHGAVPTEAGIVDIVHDESARVFSRAGKIVGHAGLFATVPDLLALLSHVLENPDERLTTNQIAQLGRSTALGWELDQSWMGTTRSSKTFGKTGFTGTSVVADFERQTALIVLTNRTYPRRPHNADAMNEFRRNVCDIVFRS